MWFSTICPTTIATSAQMNRIGTTPSCPEPNQNKNVLFVTVTAFVPVIHIATPLRILCVPSVVRKAGIWIRVTHRPLIVPITAPNAIAANTASRYRA